jgi:hypothetical protein
MANWGFWEWLAYAPIALSALISAIDWGIKVAPNIKTPGFFYRGYWSLAPLALLLVSGIVFLGIETGFLKSTPKMIVVDNHNFDHETVQLDDHSFLNCNFNEVVLTWAGGNTHLENVHFTGKVNLVIKDAKLAAAWKLVHDFESMHPNSVQVLPTPIDKY